MQAFQLNIFQNNNLATEIGHEAHSSASFKPREE